MPLRFLQLLLLEVPKVLLVLLAWQALTLVLPHHLVLTKIGRHLSIALSSLRLLRSVLVGRLLQWAPILARELLRLQLLNYLLHVLTSILKLVKFLLEPHVERLKGD